MIAPANGSRPNVILGPRTFACATSAVASDIAGYRDVVTAETSASFRAGDEHALVDAVEPVLGDEARRQAAGAAARRNAVERSSWGSIARRLADVHEAPGAR